MASTRRVQWSEIVVIGLAIGLLGGFLGKGGSAVATPLLYLVGVPAMAAVASPLPATVPATLLAAVAYHRAGLLDRRVVGWSVLSGVPATVAGAVATRWIDGTWLVTATEVVLVAIGLRLLVGSRRRAVEVVAEPSRGRLLLVGALVGAAAGLLANSGGFLLAPLYLVVARLPIKRALAASLAVSAALAVPGAVVHAALGHIDWAVTAALAITSVPAAQWGARLAIDSHPDRLERTYGAGLAALGVALLVVS